jgi:hypothetical protein
MTAIVSQERARGTFLTATIGLLMLAVAAAMMLAAAPRLDHRAAGGQPGATVTATRLTTDLSHQLAGRVKPATATSGRRTPGPGW